MPDDNPATQPDDDIATLARLLGEMKRRRSWCSSSANYRYANQLNDGAKLRTGPTVYL
jgi:hypothetical protein